MGVGFDAVASLTLDAYDADACIWVLDDLGFNGGTVAAAGKTWSGVKSLFR